MDLVVQNRRFLHVTTGAPGSVHDARLLRRSSLFQKICRGKKIPNKSISFGDAIGKIPLLTTGDSAFLHLEWLIEEIHEQTRDPKKQLFNQKLRVAAQGLLQKTPMGC